MSVKYVSLISSLVACEQVVEPVKKAIVDAALVSYRVHRARLLFVHCDEWDVVLFVVSLLRRSTTFDAPYPPRAGRGNGGRRLVLLICWALLLHLADPRCVFRHRLTINRSVPAHHFLRGRVRPHAPHSLLNCPPRHYDCNLRGRRVRFRPPRSPCAGRAAHNRFRWGRRHAKGVAVHMHCRRGGAAPLARHTRCVRLSGRAYLHGPSRWTTAGRSLITLHICLPTALSCSPQCKSQQSLRLSGWAARSSGTRHRPRTRPPCCHNPGLCGSDTCVPVAAARPPPDHPPRPRLDC